METCQANHTHHLEVADAHEFDELLRHDELGVELSQDNFCRL